MNGREFYQCFFASNEIIIKFLLYPLLGMAFILAHFCYLNIIDSGHKQRKPEFTLLDLIGNIFMDL